MTAVIALVGVVVVALVTLALRDGSGGSSKPATKRTATTVAPDRPVVRRSFLEQVIPAGGSGLPGASVPARIAAAVKAMSVEDKVAQTMLLGFEGRDASAGAPVLALLKRRPLGGIVVRRSNYASRDQVTAVAGQATLVARKARHDPPFVWAPQEGGNFSALPGLPPADVPADVADVPSAAAEAVASGRALAKLDLNGVLAPVVDVGTGGDDALGPRAFSDDPRQVAAFASAVTAAYKRAGVVSAAEHFPGLGAATQPVEDGPASVGLSLAQLRARDLIPFGAAIRAGVPAIVISNASYATDDFVTPATLSRAVSTDLLRGEMRFRGVAIADDLAQPAITTNMSVADAAVQAIVAGSDMVYISGPPRGQDAAYRALLAAARSGSLSRARLDEAVTRVLTLKREYGLVRGLRPRTKVPALAPPVVPGATTPGAPTPTAPVQPTPVPPSTQPAAPPAP
jgi:beta-N-acetylhexosaminidase